MMPRDPQPNREHQQQHGGGGIANNAAHAHDQIAHSVSANPSTVSSSSSISTPSSFDSNFQSSSSTPLVQHPLSRPDRDIKNLMHFRIPHEPVKRAASPSPPTHSAITSTSTSSSTTAAVSPSNAPDSGAGSGSKVDAPSEGHSREEGISESSARGADATGNKPINSFNISPATVDSLAKNGITNLFPIQAASFELISTGADVVGHARTGAGKTLAYALSIVERMLADLKVNNLPTGRSPRVLVLAPTRESALQIQKNFDIIKGPKLTSFCIYGGTPYSPQESALRSGTDIVVGTCGRIKDLLVKGTLKLDKVKYVVLDEADAMSNLGFEDDVELILSHIPRVGKKSGDSATVQTLLFSVNFPAWVNQIIAKYLRPDKKQVDVVNKKEATTTSWAAAIGSKQSKEGSSKSKSSANGLKASTSAPSATTSAAAAVAAVTSKPSSASLTPSSNSPHATPVLSSSNQPTVSIASSTTHLTPQPSPAASPQPNAWHRSDKPLWTSAQLISSNAASSTSTNGSSSTSVASSNASKKETTKSSTAGNKLASTLAPPVATTTSKESTEKVAPSSSTASSSGKKSTASALAKESTGGSGSAASSRSSSKTKPKVSSVSSSVPSAPSSLKKSTSKTAASTTTSAAAKAVKAVEKPSTVTPTEAAPVASVVHATETRAPAESITSSTSNTNPVASTSSSSSSGLPTVIESTLSRTNSNEASHSANSLSPAAKAALPAPSVAPAPISVPPVTVVEETPSNITPASNSPVIVAQTPPDSDLIAPLPVPSSSIPSLSLTRRTTLSSSSSSSSSTSRILAKTSGSAELTKRMFSLFLDQLSRTTNELFNLCHMYSVSTQADRCRLVLEQLQASAKPFSKLLEIAEQRESRGTSRRISSKDLSSASSSSTAAPSSTSSSSLSVSTGSSSASKPLSRSRKSVTTATTSSSALKVSSKHVPPPSPSAHTRAPSKGAIEDDSSVTEKESVPPTTSSASASKKGKESKSSSVKDNKKEKKEKSDKESSTTKVKKSSPSLSSSSAAAAVAAEEPLASVSLAAAPPSGLPPFSPNSTMSVGEGSLFGLLGLTSRHGPSHSMSSTTSSSSSISGPPRTPPHSRTARTGSSPSIPTASLASSTAGRLKRKPGDFVATNSSIPVLSTQRVAEPSTQSTAPSTSPSTKWNATSELLQSGEGEVEEKERSVETTNTTPAQPPAVTDTRPATVPAAASTTVPASAAASPKPAAPKSAWTSQSQTVSQMLSNHKANGLNGTAATKKLSSLTSKSPAFKPMQLVLQSEKSQEKSSADVLQLDDDSQENFVVSKEPLTPPRNANSSVVVAQSNRFSSLNDEGNLLTPAQEGNTTSTASLSPLQKRLNSPERLSLRHRSFAQLHSSFPGSDSNSPTILSPEPTSAGSTQTGPEQLLSAHLQSLSQSKQEKAARNREEALAARRKQGELLSVRQNDAEARRENRLRTKVEQSDVRLALAAEHAEEALETKRRKAENENNKVRELHFINAEAMEERKHSLAAKAESAEARVRALGQQKLDKITASNSRATAVVDEKRRAEREFLEKKLEQHERIDAKLELAEARRMQGKSAKLTKSNSNASNTSVQPSTAGTPNESPFTSPRSMHSLAAGQSPADSPYSGSISAAALAATLATEELPELDASYCTLCKVKLINEEYVRRHVSGKKHQSLLAEHLISGGGGNRASPEPTSEPAASGDASNLASATTNTNSNSAADSFIVNLSSLSSASTNSKSTLLTRFEPLELNVPSKSSRRNQKKKQRKLRKELAAASGSHEVGDSDAEDENDSSTLNSSSVDGNAMEELNSMPPTRLRTQALSLYGLFEKYEANKQGAAAPNGSKPLPLLVTEDFEKQLQEELQNCLVRLDEEILQLKQMSQKKLSTATPVATSLPQTPVALISPPALKVLLVNKVIQHCLTGSLASNTIGPFSVETMRLASEVVYSCCASSPHVADALLSKQRLIPLVDLACKTMNLMHSTASKEAKDVISAALSITPPSPPAYFEYVLRSLTVSLKEEDDSTTAPVPSEKSEEEEKSSTSTTTPSRPAAVSNRNNHHNDRQHMVRYICLSGLLSRISQQFLNVDRYLTRVTGASVSSTSQALANQAAQALTAASQSASTSTSSATTPTGKTAPVVASSKPARLLTSKERLTLKLAQQKSLKSEKNAIAAAIASTPDSKVTATKSPNQSIIPIHAPIVPHIGYYVQLVEFLEALTTLPAGATLNATVHTSTPSKSNPNNRVSVYNTALARAIKDTGVGGILNLVGALTLSHWIIPAQKLAVGGSSNNNSSSSTINPTNTASVNSSIAMSVRSILTTRSKALSTSLSHDSVAILCSAFRAFNNLGRFDRALLQDFSENFQPHLFEILNFLLPYSLAHLPKLNISTTSGNNLHNQLLELIITFMGSICLLSPTNQRMMREWKDGQEATSASGLLAAESAASAPSSATTAATVTSNEESEDKEPQLTLMQQLCRLPPQFYSDPRLQNLLFPSLLSIAFSPSSAPASSAAATADGKPAGNLMVELGEAHAQAMVQWMESVGGIISTVITKVQTDASVPDTVVAEVSASDANDSASISRSASSGALKNAVSGTPLSPAVATKSSVVSSASAATNVATKKRSSSGAEATTADTAGLSKEKDSKATSVKSRATTASTNPTKSSAASSASGASKKAAASSSASSSSSTTSSNSTLSKSKSTGKGLAQLPSTTSNSSVAERKQSSDGTADSAPPVVVAAATAFTPSASSVPLVAATPAAAATASQLSSAPVVFPNSVPLNVRADLQRRFPLELWKAARVSLFQ